jgi:uncharacterized membrane protein
MSNDDLPDLNIFEKIRIAIGVLLLVFGAKIIQFGVLLADDRKLRTGEILSHIERLNLEKQYGKAGLAHMESFYETYLKKPGSR